MSKVLVASHVKLVSQIKEWQRRGPGHKKAWDVFCTENGDSKLDPNLKSEPFLQSFLDGTEDGSITPIEDGGIASDAPLVDQVKSIQRQGVGYKEAWWKFCRTRGSSEFDPARHDEGFLRTFVNGIQSGIVQPEWTLGEGATWWGRGRPQQFLVPGMSPDKLELVNQVKEWQRRSPGHKKAWDTYCTENGHSKLDPNLKDEAFLQSFLDGTQDGVILPLDESEVGGAGESMIDQVKRIQRQSTGFKEAWWKFCRDKGSGDFDPARHDEETLQEFVIGINNGIIMPEESVTTNRGGFRAPATVMGPVEKTLLKLPEVDRWLDDRARRTLQNACPERAVEVLYEIAASGGMRNPSAFAMKALSTYPYKRGTTGKLDMFFANNPEIADKLDESVKQRLRDVDSGRAMEIVEDLLRKKDIRDASAFVNRCLFVQSSRTSSRATSSNAPHRSTSGRAMPSNQADVDHLLEQYPQLADVLSDIAVDRLREADPARAAQIMREVAAKTDIINPSAYIVKALTMHSGRSTRELLRPADSRGPREDDHGPRDLEPEPPSSGRGQNRLVPPPERLASYQKVIPAHRVPPPPPPVYQPQPTATWEGPGYDDAEAEEAGEERDDSYMQKAQTGQKREREPKPSAPFSAFGSKPTSKKPRWSDDNYDNNDSYGSYGSYGHYGKPAPSAQPAPRQSEGNRDAPGLQRARPTTSGGIIRAGGGRGRAADPESSLSEAARRELDAADPERAEEIIQELREKGERIRNPSNFVIRSLEQNPEPRNRKW